MAIGILTLVVSLAVAIKGTTLATRYSGRLAENFRLASYVVGFIIIAFISILPETIIVVSSALQDIPQLGLGTLFGSNIADLSLIFGLLIFISGRGIKIEAKILKNVSWYPLFIFLPLLFGLDGNYSRIDGAALILGGVIFYYMIFRNSTEKVAGTKGSLAEKLKNFLMLLFAMFLLLLGSHFTVVAASDLAGALNVAPILVGLLVVSLGTTMPEFLYSLRAMKRQDDSLAVGDILGSVLADATIVVGILALLAPFAFPVRIIYVTGAFMLISSLLLVRFMRSGRVVTRKEGLLLFAFWIGYALIEFFANI